jgi:hypothetical protein
VPQEYNVLVLIKGEERFLYVYDDESRPALLDAFRDHAAHPGLDFSWFDATVMTEKAHEQSATAPARPHE